MEEIVFTVIDYGDKPSEMVYCDARRLSDGTIVIEAFGRIIDMDEELEPCPLIL